MKRMKDEKRMDPEWVLLIKQAKEMGIDIEEVKEFLDQTIVRKRIL
ncbi:anti-repressor SinI family protein [Halobacillus yeomjeoni]|nr:anti-repressor SinI family protein [Halobacillus yeomjeoni]MCA0985224.1 anti-repressor SinI family protein [Halobacillus yeomjeoni]